MSRGNDVTMVLVLYRISRTLFGIFFEKKIEKMLYVTCSLDKCLLLCQVSQKSIRGISRYLGNSIKRVWIMHVLKTGLNADKFATFWVFPKRYYRSFVCKWPLYTLEAAERKYTCAISKHMNVRVNQGKTQCWALFVISVLLSGKQRLRRARRNGCFRRLRLEQNSLIDFLKTFLVH